MIIQLDCEVIYLKAGMHILYRLLNRCGDGEVCSYYVFQKGIGKFNKMLLLLLLL